MYMKTTFIEIWFFPFFKNQLKFKFIQSNESRTMIDVYINSNSTLLLMVPQFLHFITIAMDLKTIKSKLNATVLPLILCKQEHYDFDSLLKTQINPLVS